MNTPAHVVASLLILGDRDRPETGLPLVVGALLPDAPIVAFYAYQKLWRGMPEAWIWSEGYYLPQWQAFFDVFNSLPLILVGLLAARAAGSVLLAAGFASMGVHVLGDLPLHHDDAHRHLFPFSDWRFESPVSYWDPAHHGALAGLIESISVLTVALWMYWRWALLRPWVAVTTAVYLLYWVYVFMVWV